MAGKLTNLQRIRLIEEVIGELRPYFKRDGGDCELVDVDGDHVYVRLSGACNGCQMESQTLNGVRERLSEKLGRPTLVVPIHIRSVAGAQAPRMRQPSSRWGAPRSSPCWR